MTPAGPIDAPATRPPGDRTQDTTRPCSSARVGIVDKLLGALAVEQRRRPRTRP